MTTSIRNMAFRPAIMLFLGALLGGGGQGEIFAQDDNRGYKVQVGDAVPDFSLTDLDGKTCGSYDVIIPTLNDEEFVVS